LLAKLPSPGKGVSFLARRFPFPALFPGALLLLLLLSARPALARSYVVFGYAPEDWPGDTLALSSARAQAANLDGVIYYGYRIDGQGQLEGWDSAGLMDWARKNGKKILLAVHNFRNGAFDSGAADGLLRNPAARQRAIANLLSLMKRGYSGVNLDLENVPPADRELLSSFVAELGQALRREGYLATASVPAKTFDDPWNAWSYAFDYRALGQALDYVTIMAYDEHWAGGSPGPVASLPWVEQVARYALSTIPREKILLGLPAHGYDWYPGGADYISFAQAESRARRYGATIQWDVRAQVPYYRYWDAYGRQHTVYYENASSMAGKVDLVTSLGLGGVAIWRLGFEDPASWQGVIYGKLKWNAQSASFAGAGPTPANPVPDSGTTGTGAAPAAATAATSSAPDTSLSPALTPGASTPAPGAPSSEAPSPAPSPEPASPPSPAPTPTSPSAPPSRPGETTAPVSGEVSAPGATSSPALGGNPAPGDAPGTATSASGDSSDTAAPAPASAPATAPAPGDVSGTAPAPGSNLPPGHAPGTAAPAPGPTPSASPARVVIIILSSPRLLEVILQILRALGLTL
jgi:spore germination protein YaaH